MPLYAGPIIDAHHHLWAYQAGHHAWLDQAPAPGGESLPMGDLAPLRRDFLVEDYLALAEGEGIVGTVHVEASWVGGPPGAETAWLDSLDRSVVARRHVFHVDLTAPDAADRVRVEAAHPRAAGLRDIVAWHPEPSRSFADSARRMADPAWRRGLAALVGTGLACDLLLYPPQMEEAVALAADFPGMTFVLNHCGSPADRSPQGMALWRDGIARLAERPNVMIKVSNPVAYDHHWSEESLAAVILHCLDCFGPDRSMWGTDAPVSGLQAGFRELLGVYRRVLAGRPEAEQRAFFHDTAAQVYGFGGEA